MTKTNEKELTPEEQRQELLMHSKAFGVKLQTILNTLNLPAATKEDRAMLHDYCGIMEIVEQLTTMELFIAKSELLTPNIEDKK